MRRVADAHYGTDLLAQHLGIFVERQLAGCATGSVTVERDPAIATDVRGETSKRVDVVLRVRAKASREQLLAALSSFETIVVLPN